LLQNCNVEYEQQFDKAKQAIEAEIDVLEQEIVQEKEKVRVELEKYADEHALEIKQAEVTVDFYRHERSLFNFVRSFFRIRRETGKLEGLQKPSRTIAMKLSANTMKKKPSWNKSKQRNTRWQMQPVEKSATGLKS